MSDHLDFIRIQGLEVSAAELFHGAGCSGSGVSADTASGSSSWWETLIADLEGSWESLLDWLNIRHSEASEVAGTADDEDSEETSRSRGARVLPPVVYAGAITLYKALGPTGLAIAAASVINAVVKEIIDETEDTLNPFSEQWRLYGIESRLEEIKDLLRSALLLKTLNPLDDEESILKRALLYQREGESEWTSILDDRLTEIAAIDAEFEVSDAKFSLKNHVFEYSIKN